MTWNQGTATDYLDLLDQLIQCATSRNLSAIAINNNGSGYVAGDVLGITGTGATATHTAQIEVMTVDGGGNILTARVFQGGAYTVDPTTTTGNAATGGSGTSATFNLTFADTGWTQRRRTAEAVSATVAGGGTAYTVADTLTLVGGVLAQGGSAATFTVSTAPAGVIGTVALATAGLYEVPPTSPVQVTGGTGTGATLTLTTQDYAGDAVVVLEGDAGGSNTNPVVGIKTYQLADETTINTTYNFALFGALANQQAMRLDQFSGISPGFNTSTLDGQITASATGDGAFVPLKTADAYDIGWWFSITGRRIHVALRVETASTTYYPSFSLGLLNSPGVTTEFAYPLCVIGSCDRRRVWHGDTNSVFSGLTEQIGRNNGPAFIWTPQSTVLECKNALITTNTSPTVSYDASNDAPRIVAWPIGISQIHELDDDINWQVAGSLGFDNEDMANGTPVLIYRTPNTGSDLFPLFPLTIVQNDSATDNYRILGEVDGVYWFDIAAEVVASEDRIDQGGVYYRIFQNGTRTTHLSFCAIRED